MTDAERIIELRALLQSMFFIMDEVGLDLHPMIVQEVTMMAEILGIDPDTVPTERRGLGRQ